MLICSKNRFRVTALVMLIIGLVVFYAYFLASPSAKWNRQYRPHPPPGPSAMGFEAATPMKLKGYSLVHQGWVLALPTLKTPQEAQQQVFVLQQKGFRAYSQIISEEGSRVWGIFIGPELEVETIKAIAQQLQPTQAQQARIIPFNPLA